MKKSRLSRIAPTWWGWLGILLMILPGGFACGRKALPVPPDAYVPPAVETIRGEIKGEEAVIRFVLPAADNSPARPGSRVRVFQARQSLVDPGACPDCPPDFVRVADFPARELSPDQSGRWAGRARLPLEPGYRYLFYAVVHSAEGVAGPASDTIELTFSHKGE
ncbi:MAG: hypothetical protein ACOCPQ_02260 [Desulfosudaceae bacterium]